MVVFLWWCFCGAVRCVLAFVPPLSGSYVSMYIHMHACTCVFVFVSFMCLCAGIKSFVYKHIDPCYQNNWPHSDFSPDDIAVKAATSLKVRACKQKKQQEQQQLHSTCWLFTTTVLVKGRNLRRSQNFQQNTLDTKDILWDLLEDYMGAT